LATHRPRSGGALLELRRQPQAALPARANWTNIFSYRLDFDGQVMSKSALRCGRVLFLLAIILCASASAEARHRKHYGGHRYLQQNAVKDRTWGGELPASDTSSSQGSSFGPAIAELIRGCSQEAIQLKNWPIDSIALIVGPDAAQQNALDKVRNASIETADILAATCPKEIPVALTARFDALKQAVDAFITGLDALRPAIETFYFLLNDEQKVRVLAMSANNSLETTGRPQRSSRGSAAHRDVSSVQQELPCRWLAHALRDWPIRQIEISIPLSDSQRAALYDLTASIYRAVGTLIASCPTEASLTPLGEIEVKRKRANALRQAAGIIRPVLDRFEGTLDDGQKMRLGQVIGGFNDEN
jgi:hypothetical protein